MVRRMTNTRRSQSDPQQSPSAFGETENKSLESEQTEAKDADKADAPAAAAGPTVRVQVLHHHDHDGKALIPGREYDLPARVAEGLVGAHRARLVDDGS